MANTTIKKNSQGYGYKYSDLSEIHEWLESQGYTYYQYIEPIDGNDYIYTVPIVGGKELAPRRGCKVVPASLSGKSNPVQEMGASLTYSRRYSLLMAFGLATTDDDGACFEGKQDTNKSAPTQKEMKEVEKKYIDKTKQDLLMKQCEETGVNPVALCDKLHVSSFGKITEKQFYWLRTNWTKEIAGGEQS